MAMSNSEGLRIFEQPHQTKEWVEGVCVAAVASKPRLWSPWSCRHPRFAGVGLEVLPKAEAERRAILRLLVESLRSLADLLALLSQLGESKVSSWKIMPPRHHR